MKFSISVIASCMALAVASAVPPTTSSSMKVIMDDFSKLGTQFSKIASDVNSFPQTGITGVNNIQADAGAIHTLFTDVISELDNLEAPLPANDVKRIISVYNSFTPDILDYLNGIAQKSADFKSLNSAGTISLDLLKSANKCAVLESTLMPMVPTTMTTTTSAIFNVVDAARQNALAALS
ncbi:hypothetical protein JR316_0008980 [Psilocybe cubensis]|uniref:Uncharacterized protein n=2 Tax=Psilocybe cubensis TaxID=181762 RepID=A0A8H7XYU9_PSICU|nr:hypothetical protein JR316_0008980 [Psilocybe cubensis]KAH9478525.1 hypothetical protein JR316_0008980 [Psilocybe cubensis]